MWGWLIQFGLYMGAKIYSYYTMHHGPPEGTYPLGGANIPKSEEASPVALYFGRSRMRDPQILWYGNFDAVEAYFDDGDSETPDQFLGYEYHFDLDLCIGIPMGSDSTPPVHILTVYSEEREVWSGDVTDWDDRMHIDLLVPDARIPSGGVARFYPGWQQDAPAPQPVDAKLYADFTADANLDETLLPAYHGLTRLVLGSGMVQGFAWGDNPSPPPLSVEIQSTDNPLGLGEVGSEGDANPAEVIYWLLTASWGGLGLSASDVDSTSFTAAATTLASEGNGASGNFSASQNASQVINELLKQIDGAIRHNPETGKIELKLVRDDYTLASLTLFDETNVDADSVSWNTQTDDDVFNSVLVRYEDRASLYGMRGVVEQNMSLMIKAGEKRRLLTNTYPFCKTKTLAKQLAARDLHAMSHSLPRLRFKTNRDAVDVRVGDVIKFSWSAYGLSSVPIRVQEVDTGTLESDPITIGGMVDKFATAHSTWDPTGEVLPVVPVPTAMTYEYVFESPRWINYNQAVTGVEAPHMMYAFARPTSGTNEKVEARTSADDGASYQTERWGVQFSIRATVETDYSREEGPYDTTTGLRITFASASDAASALHSASEYGIRQYGGNMLLVRATNGDEILFYESYTLISGTTYRLNNVWGGGLDTSRQDLTAGDEVWLQLWSDMWTKLSEHVLGTGSSVRVKGLTRNLWGRLAEKDATPVDVSMTNRAVRPAPADDLQVDGAKSGTLVEDGATWTWLRRKYDLVTIYRPDDADDAESGTYYKAQGRIVSDGSGVYVPDDQSWITTQDDISAASLKAAHVTIGHGDAELRLQNWKYFPPYVGLLKLEAYQPPTLKFTLPRYRNLLQNPSFEDGLTGWTVVGTPSTGVTGMGSEGYSAGGDNSNADWNLQQDIDVSTGWYPEGLVARLRMPYLPDGTDSVQITLYALDSGGSTLASATTGIVISGTAQWVNADLSVTCPAGTVTLRVEVDQINHSADNTGPSVDEAFLTLGDDTGQLLTDASFESGTLPAWTKPSLWNTGSGGAEQATQMTPGHAASDELYQEITLATGYKQYGTAHARYRTKQTGTDTAHLVLTARDSGGTVLATSTATLAPSADGIWHREDVYLDLPANTDKIRFSFVTQTYSGGVADHSQQFDDCWLDVHRQLNPIHQHTVLTFYDAPEQKWWRDPLDWVSQYGAPEPEQIWMLDETSGTTLEGAVEYSTPSAYDLTVSGSPILGQTYVGTFDGTDYANKACLETQAGGSNGVTFARVTDMSIDGASSWALCIPFKELYDGYLAGSLSGGQGWYLVSSSGFLTFHVEDDASGSANATTLLKYAYGQCGYAVIYYDASADEIGIWTHAESAVTASVSALGDMSNLVKPCLGYSPGQNSADAQFPYLVRWTGATAESLAKTHTDAWWAFGTDPNGSSSPFTLSADYNITVPIDSVSTGIVTAGYGKGQVPLQYGSALSHERGVAMWGSIANLCIPDPNDTTDWVDIGTVTTTRRYGDDPGGMQHSVRIQGNWNGGRRTTNLASGGAGDAVVTYYAKTNEASGHNINVKALDDTSSSVASQAQAITTTWQRYTTIVSWDGSTSSFQIEIDASDTSTSRDVEIAGPICVTLQGAGAGLDAGPTSWKSGTVTAHDAALNATLDARFVYEGEVSITGTAYDASLASSNTPYLFHGVRAGSGNNDRRSLAISATSLFTFSHFDGVGTAASSTEVVSDWSAEWTCRGRWNFGGLSEDRTKFAQTLAPDGTSTYNRSATWTAAGLALDNLRVGRGVTATQYFTGIISRIELAARERPELFTAP